MAETSVVLKRLREQEEETTRATKRDKSNFNQILSLLEQDYEEEPSSLIHDVSSFITTLQQELSSHDQDPPDPTLLSSTFPNAIDSSSPSSNSLVSKYDHEEEQEDVKDYQGMENVLRQLVEASDDELGIPSSELTRVEEDEQQGGVEFLFCDGLWEFEDITANYYDSFLQLEQFL